MSIFYLYIFFNKTLNSINTYLYYICDCSYVSQMIMIKFSILQLNKNCSEYSNKLFTSIHILEKLFETTPNINDYNVIYTGELSNENTEDNDFELCEKIFKIFNISRPDDFVGHSLSVSDIVEINGNYYFCDDFGFVKL